MILHSTAYFVWNNCKAQVERPEMLQHTPERCAMCTRMCACATPPATMDWPITTRLCWRSRSRMLWHSDPGSAWPSQVGAQFLCDSAVRKGSLRMGRGSPQAIKLIQAGEHGPAVAA